MRLQLTSFVALTCAARGASAMTTTTTCAYMDAAPPIEYDLPLSSVFGSTSLPIQFVGVTPTVIRQQIPPGGTPKVTVTKYSSTPVVAYDPNSGTVQIALDQCDHHDVSIGFSAAPQSYGVGLLLLAAAMTQQPVLVAATAAWVLPTLAGAQGVCDHVVEVVVEAPAAYVGAVETCLAEVTETGHCPTPFPTFATCGEVRPECQVAVVGAGAGGLYAALRYVENGVGWNKSCLSLTSTSS